VPRTERFRVIRTRTALRRVNGCRRPSNTVKRTRFGRADAVGFRLKLPLPEYPSTFSYLTTVRATRIPGGMTRYPASGSKCCGGFRFTRVIDAHTVEREQRNRKTDRTTRVQCVHLTVTTDSRHRRYRRSSRTFSERIASRRTKVRTERVRYTVGERPHRFETKHQIDSRPPERVFGARARAFL